MVPVSFDERVIAAMVHMLGGDVTVPEEFCEQVEDEDLALVIWRERDPDAIQADYRVQTVPRERAAWIDTSTALRRKWGRLLWLDRERANTAHWRASGRSEWEMHVRRKLMYAVADVRRGACCPSWGDPRVDGDAKYLTSPDHPRDPVHQPSWKRSMEGLD